MELLSNGNHKMIEKKPEARSSSIEVSDRVFYSSFFKSPPSWEIPVSSEPMRVPLPNPVGKEISRPSEGTSFSSPSSYKDVLSNVGAIGSMTPSTSPQTSASSVVSNGMMPCGRCDITAGFRCIHCNDMFCEECVIAHKELYTNRDHRIVSLNSSPVLHGASSSSNGKFTDKQANFEYQCFTHNEDFRYLCETCKKVVCQECTLWEHKDHVCTPLKNIFQGAREKIQAILESGKIGTKYIKTSIDRAVTFSQTVERDSNDCATRIKKAMRHFILAAEDRERVLLERIEKYRMQKLSSLTDQMAGLRSALANLAQTSEQLNKSMESLDNLSPLEVAKTLIEAEKEMEQCAAMFKSLQPKEEFLNFIPPNFDILQDIRVQGEIVISPQRVPVAAAANVGTMPLQRRQSTSSIKGGTSQSSSWEMQSTSKAVVGITPLNVGVGQCIPGSNYHVSAKPALEPSFTFAFDGHEDGQVSRPWGLCTDKDGNIIVADRRNNRIQVFSCEGVFKHKFGCKGTGDGQFDLPAGISTDPQNRIVVVDKDNHRVQIFTNDGRFLLKFGTYGKECGQFQYPWDCAVNSKGDILVTDSRNHRIQLFNQHGNFISRFGFDGSSHSRYLKGLTTPRGACFTPTGDVIISDFENHRLLLIDSDLTKIIAAKGHEGSGTHEFSRPSGICCDDDGRVIVADSKNQRVIIFSHQLEFLWTVEIRPSGHNPIVPVIDEKDRPSDIALLPDGRLVIMVETSPDARDICNPQKTFIQVY